MSRWILVLVLCALSGCVAAPQQDRAPGNMFGGLFGPDTEARSPTPPPASRADLPPGSQDVIYTASGETGAAGGVGGPLVAGVSTEDNGATYSLNFEGVDIATAAKAIIGDILNQPYSIDPRVVGQLSLATARPIKARDLLFIFESALAANGAALVKSGQGYNIIPLVEAQGAGQTAVAADGTVTPGFGVSIMPIRFVSTQTLQQLMEGFSSKPGMLRIEPSRNLLIIQGTGPERATAMAAAIAFDADWMRDQAVGVFVLEHASPQNVISELQQIFETEDGGLGANLVKFRPIERLNAVMAVSKRRALVERAGHWIRRLDASATTTPRVYVYTVRYGDAKAVAAILNDMFGGSSSASPPTAPDAPVESQTTNQPQFDATGQPILAPPPTTPPNTDTTVTGSTSSGGIKITADTSNNTIVVLADGVTYRKIESALREIDRPRLQVAVNAIVAEVTLNDKLANGIEFYLKSSDIGLGNDNGSISFGTTDVLKKVLPGFNFLLGPKAEPRLVLSALDSITDVKVLSSPSIVVNNNQKAVLQVGAQVPIATRQATDVTDPTAPIVNNIEFRDTGVILKVTPKINENGVVVMDIEQEISAVSKDSAAGTLTPVITTRKVASQISVVSGQTVILGGLISEQENSSADGLPFLNRTKFLGILGGRRTADHVRTELIMFIRPVIIRDGQDAANVTNEMALQLRNMLAPGIDGSISK